MDGASEQSGQGQRRLLTSPCPAQLSQRREHLSHLLQRHVALIDEIQRSAKELTSGQDEYITSQIHHLRQAADGVHRAAAAEPVTGSGGPWSAEHPGSHSPKSSNDEILFHNNNTGQRDGTSRPVPTPQLVHPMILPQASSGCLPESVPRLNSSMSCDELLSMLDSVTNPGVVSGGHCSGGGRNAHNTISKDANKDTTTGGSPVSRPKKRSIRDASFDGIDGGPMPSLPAPPLRRNDSSNVIAALEPNPQQLQVYRSVTPTLPVPIPQAPTSTGGHLQPLSIALPSAPEPLDYSAPLLPQDRSSMPHLVAPKQSEKLAQSPFSATAFNKPSQGGASAPLPSQQMALQVYHTHHHHHPGPSHVIQQQQQQHRYGGVNPPMMSALVPHAHAHHHNQQQQQQQHASTTLPGQQRIGVPPPAYPPHPRQMGMTNGMPPMPMRQMSPTPYGNMMGMPPQPPPPLPGWHNRTPMQMPLSVPPHHRMNMPPPILPHPHYIPTMASKGMAIMGPPPRRGPLGLNSTIASGMLPMHPHPLHYNMAKAPPLPLMQRSMHAGAANGAAPVAVNAIPFQKMPLTDATIPVPSSLPPVRVTPAPAAAGGEKNTNDTTRDNTTLKLDQASLPPMPSAQLLADLPSLSPHALLSPAGGLGDPSTLSSLAVTMPHRDMNTGNDPFHDINHIHLSPEEFDAVLAAFDTPGLEDAQT